eukprot:TRINITY_DN13867_c0_g1_i1.p1 TRINITY_DN13867_c0_g1~~TRINITY_DN13867_c0_g1_i1.p1  ORF type:complete len:100 (+),score=0.35 TRINITY_DN13867_c0_g1_i1:247-546(+)
MNTVVAARATAAVGPSAPKTLPLSVSIHMGHKPSPCHPCFPTAAHAVELAPQLNLSVLWLFAHEVLLLWQTQQQGKAKALTRTAPLSQSVCVERLAFLR